jgi:hypothetical protein
MVYQGACDRAQSVCDVFWVDKQTDIDDNMMIDKVNKCDSIIAREGHRHDEVVCDKARQGKARQGKARQGKARQGKARQGKARQGKAGMSHD